MIDRTTLAAAAGFVAMVGAGWLQAAHAAPAPQDTVSVPVSLAQLDLSTSDGAGVALHRIRAAARMICGEPPAIIDLNASHQYRACTSSAVNGAVDRLGNPIVAALNEGRTPDEAFASGR